jgi:hypothetical protein
MRTYYRRGSWVKSIYTKRDELFGLVANSGEIYESTPEATDIDFGTRTGDPTTRMAQIVMPAITAKIHHLMKRLQEYNKLITQSGVIRFDLGFETLPAGNTQNYKEKAPTKRIEEDEFNACLQQPQPAQWSATGHGWIVRTFLNEVAARAHRRREKCACTRSSDFARYDRHYSDTASRGV